MWTVAGAAVAADGSGDAYIRNQGNRWTLGTASVERVVAFEEGRLLLKSFRNKTTGRELAPAASAEFFFRLNENPEPVTSATGPWKLVRAEPTRLGQGELCLELVVERDSLQVTKTYVVYPGSSVIREWISFKNAGNKPLVIAEPGFLDLHVKTGDPASLDFLWMSGGSNEPASWKLKTESLAAAKPRTFDSYEPFPFEAEEPARKFPGDGVNAKILLNDRQAWPPSGWQYVANSTVQAPVDFRAEVKAGDKLVFLVNMNKNIGFDTTAFDPTIAYDGGPAHKASKEFTGEQGKNGWRYQYLQKGQFVDLVYYPEWRQWRKKKDNATGTPFVGDSDQHPDSGQDAARVWTASKAGRIHVTASVSNRGNGGRARARDTRYHGRPGTLSYAPWAALFSKDTRDGLFVGWDYFGHWASSFALGADGAVTVQLKVAGHKQTLAPGDSLTTPIAFAGLFRDDLDAAGNECLDWQYRYLWDYTREPWFPAIRMLGYWMKGTGWGQQGVGWLGGNPDLESTFRKVFRVADLMRYCGADVYHRDWGWWDRAGDWNGPDFRTTGSYLRKSGMGQLIYAFLYTVSPESKFAKAHPDSHIGSTLDMSRPEVVEHMKRQLDEFCRRWGDFEWRNDSFFTAARKGDDTPILGQDVGFRKILRDFLDGHPACAFQAVNGGGNYGGYDYTRYCSAFSFSDGAVGILRNYHAALLFPPDKTSDIPDVWNPDRFDKATWRGLLCINFDMTGDTWDPAKLEGVRELIDIYHYLHRQGVVGRWVKVYRPTITGDDPTMYFQRLSGDRLRGIVIPKRPAPGPVTIRPKGLSPAETYTVSFHESAEIQKRTGADLLQRGITLDKMPPGELIYLNLPLHPGSKLDKTAPTAPSDASLRAAENMGYPGVELRWKPGADDNWVSYYDIFRDGRWLDRVAKGTYYFDHSAGADLAAKYEVCTVDGAGNASARICASGPKTQPAVVVDDASAAVVCTGSWKRQKDLLPAHCATLSTSDQAGASATLAVEGRRLLWFSKLGATAGLASVSIDGGPAETVDTYSADDIWGVCVFRKQFPAAGRHTVKITVLGRHGSRSKGDLVAIDGFRAER
jgi:hypothetical protein